MFKRFTYQRILLLLFLFLYMPFSCAMEDWESLKGEFFKAAQEGNIKKIKDFIINTKLMYVAGDTAFIIAVKNKRIEVVKELIQWGIDINRQNDTGQTALTLAIEAKDLEMVKVLLDAGADISEKYVGNKTPLVLAIETNDLKIIEEILNQVPDPAVINEATTFTKTDEARMRLGANTSKVLELLTKAENQYELYEKIKEKISDSDISDIKTFIATHPIISLNVTNIARNPLIVAIMEANLELVNFFIGKGANVNQNFGEVGKTPLMAAATAVDEPNIEIIISLLEKGADPNIGFLEKGTLMTPFIGVIVKLVIVIKKLEKAISKGKKDDEERYRKEKQNYENIIKLLSKYGAKVNEAIPLEEGKNTTPFILVVVGGNVELVRDLLEAGADPLLKNSKGQTARDMAVIELGKVTKELGKAVSKGKKNEEDLYRKEKQNYENIIKLLKAKEKEIAGKKIPTTIADQKTLLTSLQNFTQKLNALRKTLIK